MSPPYEAVWVQHAADQFNSLPQHARHVIVDVVAVIQQDPHTDGRYDPNTDRYSTSIERDSVTGLVSYLVAERQLRVVILRITML